MDPDTEISILKGCKEVYSEKETLKKYLWVTPKTFFV